MPFNPADKIFRTTIEGSPIPSAVNDGTGNIVYMNSAFTRILGYTLQDMQNMVIALPKLYPDPDYRAWVMATWENYLNKVRQGESDLEPVEFKIVAKNGAVKTVLFSSTPLSDKENGARLITLIDITQRKQYEVALKESEERLQLALSGGEIATWDWDISGDGLNFSQKWLDLQGLSDDELPRQFSGWSSRVHPDDLNEAQEALGRHLRGEAPIYISEHRIKHKDGHWVWVLSQGKVQERDANGMPLRMVGVVFDISRRRLTEALLLEQKQQLELAVSAADLVLWNLDVRSGNFQFNSRWYSMLGYDPDEFELTQANIKRTVHPADMPGVEEKFQLHLQGDTPDYESEHRLLHQSGHWVWVLSRGKVVSRDAEGKPLLVAGVNYDISNRKRLKLEGGELLRRIETLVLEMGEQINQFGDNNKPPTTTTDQFQALTARQRKVLELIATGMTSAQIAAQLNISHDTAITHRRNLMRKLGLHSTAEMTRFALQNKLVPG